MTYSLSSCMGGGTGTGWPDVIVSTIHGRTCLARRMGCSPPIAVRVVDYDFANVIGQIQFVDVGFGSNSDRALCAEKVRFTVGGGLS